MNFLYTHPKTRHNLKSINQLVIAVTGLIAIGCSGSDSAGSMSPGDVADKPTIVNPAPSKAQSSASSALGSMNSGIQNDWGSLERDRMSRNAIESQKKRDHDLALKDKDMQLQREQMAADKDSELLQGIVDITALGAMLQMVTKDKCAPKNLFASMRDAGSSLGDALAAAKKAEQQSLAQPIQAPNGVGGVMINQPQTPPSAPSTSFGVPGSVTNPQPTSAANPPPAATPAGNPVEAQAPEVVNKVTTPAPTESLSDSPAHSSAGSLSAEPLAPPAGFKIPPLGAPLPDDWI